MEHRPNVIDHVALVLAAIFDPNLGDVEETDDVSVIADVVAGRDPRGLANHGVVQVPRDSWHGVPGADALEGDGLSRVGRVFGEDWDEGWGHVWRGIEIYVNT